MLMIVTLLRLILWKSALQLAPTVVADSSLEQRVRYLFKSSLQCGKIHDDLQLNQILEQMINEQYPQLLASGSDAAKLIKTNVDQANLPLLLNSILKLGASPALSSVSSINAKGTSIEARWHQLVDGSRHVNTTNVTQLNLQTALQSQSPKSRTTNFFLVDCENDQNRQLWSIAVVFATKSDSYLVLKFSSRQLDLNQCTPLADSHWHKCQPNASQCQFNKGLGFQLGSYQCCCNREKWNLDRDMCVNGKQIENSSTKFNEEWWSEKCNGDLNFTLRTAFLVTNSFCVVVALILIGVVAKQRTAQQYGVRGWALMEIFSGGAALLYSIVIFEYFSPAKGWSCCLMMWFRELGFATFYGAIVLKTYRNLIEYRVRKAHHVYVKEKDLFKYLACALALTSTGLVAWTLGVSQTRHQTPFLTEATTSDNISYDVCRLHYWSIAWQLYELMFLLYGLWLCYKARNTTWIERWQFTVAVCLEILVTLTANIIRFCLWHTTSPDTLLTVSFVQLQLTVSVNTILIVVPKFYYVSMDGSKRLPPVSSSARAHPSLAKLRDNLVNGTIDFAEVPIADMNPEDIRAELKRVYMQLRMYKLKNIYSDNPHISKRKGGKKSSDRDRHNKSNRRLSIPPSSPPSNLAKKPEKSIMEEEKSSMMDQSLNVMVTPTTIQTMEQSVPSCHTGPPVNNTDLTVESSPHNVYLAKGAVAATKKFTLEPDHSVRV